jgi:hypothetical protein
LLRYTKIVPSAIYLIHKLVSTFNLKISAMEKKPAKQEAEGYIRNQTQSEDP